MSDTILHTRINYKTITFFLDIVFHQKLSIKLQKTIEEGIQFDVYFCIVRLRSIVRNTFNVF